MHASPLCQCAQLAPLDFEPSRSKNMVPNAIMSCSFGALFVVQKIHGKGVVAVNFQQPIMASTIQS